MTAQVPGWEQMRGVGAFRVAGGLEKHQARDLTALDRFKLLVHENMVACGGEPEHAGGESP